MQQHKHRADPRKSLVGFVVGDVAYALPIAVVREIINPGALTALPHAPPAVLGVASHRGQIIPIVDLRERFGLPRAPGSAGAKWIVITVEARWVGLVVDRVTDVFGTSGAELQPAPDLGGGEEARGILGVTQHEGALVFVLVLC